jgi:hypothetical protein
MRGLEGEGDGRTEPRGDAVLELYGIAAADARTVWMDDSYSVSYEEVV